MSDQQISSARQTYLNMKAILPELQPDADPDFKSVSEAVMKARMKRSQSAHVARVEAFFCARWNCALSTLRHCTANKYPPTRSFSDGNPQFFTDLRKYGAAKFTKAGKLIESSLSKGKDRAEYAAEVYGYKQLRAEAKRKEERALKNRAAA